MATRSISHWGVLIAILAALASNAMSQTANNRPRTTSGGAGDDGRCGATTAATGATQLVLIDQPRDIDSAPVTQDMANYMDTATLADPTVPTADGDTVMMDGSLRYIFPLLEPPSITSTRLGLALVYRTWTDSSHTFGSATVGFDGSLHCPPSRNGGSVLTSNRQ